MKIRKSLSTRKADMIIILCKQSGEYTILMIITDGGVTDFDETKELLVNASNKPLSVVLVRSIYPVLQFNHF